MCPLFSLLAHLIITVVNDLSNSNDIRLDVFMTKVIKLMYSREPLMHIFNRSFEVGTFLNNLKHEKVISVFKTDDELLISNYRPISILPVLSKALEKIMHSRLMTFFVNKLISYFKINMVSEKSIQLTWQY